MSKKLRDIVLDYVKEHGEVRTMNMIASSDWRYETKQAAFKMLEIKDNDNTLVEAGEVNLDEFFQ